MSKTRTVKCGIPQGSNLGPLLFLLYINDLPNCLTSSSASMFADDTNISTNGKTNDELQERINVDLENVHQWLLANKLTLNKDKTEYMIIGSRQRISNIVTDPKIELGESVIKRVHKTKTLGVIIDEHLYGIIKSKKLSQSFKRNRNDATNKTVCSQINLSKNI